MRNSFKRIAEKIKSYFTTKTTHKQFVIFTSVVFGVITCLLYMNLWNSYFIQDEWYYFGLFNQFTHQPLGFLSIFIQQFTQTKLFGIHFTPLWNSLAFLEYQFFGVNFIGYALLSMLMHVVTAMLTLYLVWQLTRQRVLSFLSGFFFLILPAHYEAVIWANAHIRAQVSAIVLLLCCNFWLVGIESKKKPWFIIVCLLLIAGLLIKETTFALFIILPLLSYLYKKRLRFLTSTMYLVVTFFIYLPFRVFLPLILRTFDKGLDVGSSVPTGFIDLGPQFMRLILYPCKALLQSIIPPDAILFLGEKVTTWAYPVYAKGAVARSGDFLTFAQTAGSDIAMIFLSVPCGIFLWFVYTKIRKDKNDKIKKLFFISLLFIVASVIPLLIIADWEAKLLGIVTFIASRNLYTSTIGVSMLIAVIIVIFYKITKKKHLITTIAFVICFYLASCTFFYVRNAVQIGSERANIVHTIVSIYPKIKEKSIFYIKSNTQYYGYVESIVPFQTNFGYTLLINYQQVMSYPNDFFLKGFLLEKGITGEDYKEVNNKGFGYFISGNGLINALKNYNLSPEHVYAFSYDGVKKETTDITKEIRLQLQTVLYGEKTRDWIPYEDKSHSIGFKYPNTYILTQDSNETNDTLQIIGLYTNNKKVIDIKINKNLKQLDIESFVLAQLDSQGNPIRSLGETTRPQIAFGGIDKKTVIQVDLPDAVYVFIPTKEGNYVTEIIMTKGDDLKNFPLSDFYQTMEVN